MSMPRSPLRALSVSALLLAISAPRLAYTDEPLPRPAPRATSSSSARAGAIQTFQGAQQRKIKFIRCFPKEEERKCVKSIKGPFVITDVLFRTPWLILTVARDAEEIQTEGFIPRWLIDRHAAYVTAPYVKLYIGDIHGHFEVGPDETLFLAAPDLGDFFDVTISGYRPAEQ